MLDFKEIKQIKISEIVAQRYHVKLRYRGEWASAPCPLPTHKQGDKSRTFTINLQQNYWRCFSASCNENNGGKKGGDCINFVALMETCRERDAAQKIAEWFSITQNKSRSHIETGPRKELALEKPTPANSSLEPSTPAIAVKGYVHEVGNWLDGVLSKEELEAFEEYKARVKRALVGKIVESYRNGKAAPR